MNLAVVLELATIATYIVILAGGKQKRQAGWKLLSFMLLIAGAVQCAAMAIVVSLPIPSGGPMSYVLLLMGDRHTLMITIIGSSLAGGWTSPGCYAQLAGV
jgi:formate hydrogenlyase subunit 3/multisubunit Na+/H+ antiporter MnhD subunit